MSNAPFLQQVRALAVGLCLALMALSAGQMLVDHHAIMQRVFSSASGENSIDPVMVKGRRLLPVLPVSADEPVGYVTDFEEPGFRKQENFYIARYMALPIILKMFKPGQRLVVADMRSANGVEIFCQTWGYKAIKAEESGATLLEKVP
ncbi:MAG: hypothetical protein OEZ32_00575 [Nitrospinota bacterium]|nr:hypothetical protein [Nitrospinota bacterium]